MLKKNFAGLVAAAVLFSISFVESAKAVGSGGFEIPIISAKALGMGNAFTAQADDPTAIYFNPAGLTQMEGVNISLGMALVSPVFKYKSAQGQSYTADKETFIIPDLFASWRINENFAAGLGAYSNYGLGTDWGELSSLRYVATEASLAVFDVNPCVSYKMNDELSFALGLDYYLLDELIRKKRIPVALVNYTQGDIGNYADGNSEMTSDGSGIGANLGVLYKPVEGHSVGLMYKSPAKVDVEGDLKMTGLSGTMASLFGASYTTGIDTDFTLPPRFIIGYAWQAMEKLIVELDYEWTGWSTYSTLEIKVDETNPARLAALSSDLVDNNSWKDTSSVGIGGQYALNENWKLRGGWCYSENPVTQKYFKPSIVDSSRNSILIGAGYTINNITIDAGYGYSFFNSRNVKNDVGATILSDVDGKYEKSASTAALNVNYKF